MDLITGELRDYLDPTAIRILKKRLVSGKITPRVFKDILKRQMVKYFFQTYRHPLIKSWENLRKPAPHQLRDRGIAKPRLRSDTFEAPDHKRF